MPFVTVDDGCRIHYQFEGDTHAPVLLLASPLGTDLHFWDHLIPELNSQFRMLRYDPRGHGQSGAPSGEYTLARLARDVLALLDQLQIARVNFCGVSMGGAVGQWLAAQAGERIERMVLINTAASFGPAEFWQGRMESVLKEGIDAMAPSSLEVWFTPAFRDAAPLAVKRIMDMLKVTPAAGYAGCCAALRDTNLRPQLARITAPTLVIGGAYDYATPPEAAHELAELIPDANLALLECAHLSPIEKSASVKELIKGFLTK